MEFIAEHFEAFLMLWLAGMFAVLTVSEIVSHKTLGVLMITLAPFAALTAAGSLDILGHMDRTWFKVSMRLILGIICIESAALGLACRPASRWNYWFWFIVLIGAASLLHGIVSGVRAYWY